MRGVFLAGAVVGAALMVALAAAGGIGYSREVDYLECERFAVPLAEVSIRPSGVGSVWGNAGFLEFARYGPPYDLKIRGTLDAGDAATAFEITDLTVEADGVPVLSLPRVVVPVEEVRAPDEHLPGARGYLFGARAFTAATPRRLRVAGTLSRLAPSRDKGVRFSHDFEARRTHHLALGRWTWTF